VVLDFVELELASPAGRTSAPEPAGQVAQAAGVSKESQTVWRFTNVRKHTCVHMLDMLQMRIKIIYLSIYLIFRTIASKCKYKIIIIIIIITV